MSVFTNGKLAINIQETESGAPRREGRALLEKMRFTVCTYLEEGSRDIAERILCSLTF